jgi:rhodanese-related sulfurtransferase
MPKRKNWLLFVAIIAMMALFVGCKGKTSDSEDLAYEILTRYMANNSMDLSDVLNGWIVPASDVAGHEDGYYIMDIRTAEDYATGHISGAVHASLGSILTDAENSGDKPIVVACYTGQSAAHAVVALRLSGYSDARSLKFGMSSWNAGFDKWTSNTGNIANGHANWTTDATATPEAFNCPEISTTSSEGAAILTERVDALLSGGFKGINAADVLAEPEGYFVNNYWAQADVETYGHIAGAYRVKEDLTLAADGFKYLDPGKIIVTYCWTGQTSSIVTAYLTVLGYDAKSLKFGVNAMIYDQLTKVKWIESAAYDYVTD